MKALKLASIFALFLLLGLRMQAQKHESEAAIIHFSVADAKDLKVGGATEFKVEVAPKAGWHVYSAIPSDDGVYLPASLGWEIESRGFEADEKIKETGAMTEMYDDILGGQMRYYKGSVTFSQELKITESEVVLAGYFDYMACNEEKCIPLGAEFKLAVKATEK